MSRAAGGSQEQSGDSTPRREWWSRRAWPTVLRALSIPAVAAALVALIARLPFFGDMVGFDATIYLTVASGWVDGLLPYRDLFDQKGPLIFLFLASIEAIDPASVIAVRLAFVGVIVVSAALLATFVGRHAGGQVAWATAVLYALAVSSTLWDSIDVNTEQLGLPFMVAAVDLGDRYNLFGRWWHAAGTGAAVAAAFWVKPSLVLLAPLILALLVMQPGRRIRGVLSSALGALVATAATLVPFAASTNGLEALRWSVFTYNRHYADGGFDNLASRSLDDQIAWIFTAPGSAFFVAALTLGGLAWALGRHRRLVAIGTAWFLLEYAGAKLGVRDFAHYYVPVLPACAILICVGVDALSAHLTGLERRARTALALAAWLPVATYLVIAVGIQRAGAGSDARVKLADQVAEKIDDVTSPDDPIYIAAENEGFQVYWLADRNPATRFFAPHVMGAPPYSVDPSYLTEARRELAQHPPAAIVLWPLPDPSLNDYVKPAIQRGDLHQVADVEGVSIFARSEP